MAGLYVHIPFCLKKCAYCDFSSFPVGNFVQGALDDYVQTLLHEATLWQKAVRKVQFDTVFIGGGTPSLMTAQQVRALFTGLKETLNILPGAEWSMEANPGAMSADALAAAWECGANRISIGMQAAQQRHLSMLGRAHQEGDIDTAVRMARDAGFQNINLDVMYGLPNQTAQEFMDTLSRAIALAPTHISAYSLIVEEGTRFCELQKLDQLPLPDEDALADMEQQGRELLANAGYAQYEVSNYALAGCECRHNINYWLNGIYLGLGAAAHSSMVLRRWENAPNLTQYTDSVRRGQIPISRDRQLDADEAAMETVMMGFRLKSGIELEGFRKRFGKPFFDTFPSVHRLMRMGMALEEDGYVKLSDRGFDVMNTLLVELMKDVPQ